MTTTLVSSIRRDLSSAISEYYPQPDGIAEFDVRFAYVYNCINYHLRLLYQVNDKSCRRLPETVFNDQAVP